MNYKSDFIRTYNILQYNIVYFQHRIQLHHNSNFYPTLGLFERIIVYMRVLDANQLYSRRLSTCGNSNSRLYMNHGRIWCNVFVINHYQWIVLIDMFVYYN